MHIKLFMQGRRQLLRSGGGGGLASRIEFVARKRESNSYIWTPLSFDLCMCNTAYNLKAVFSSLAFLNFGRPFAVTACTHSNMSLKSGGASAPQPLAYTLVMTSMNHDPWFLNLPCILLLSIIVSTNPFWSTSLYLLSNLLQPQWEQDYRQRCLCNRHSFTSEPEPSGVKVSSAIHVLFLKRCSLVLQW